MGGGGRERLGRGRGGSTCFHIPYNAHIYVNNWLKYGHYYVLLCRLFVNGPPSPQKFHFSSMQTLQFCTLSVPPLPPSPSLPYPPKFPIPFMVAYGYFLEQFISQKVCSYLFNKFQNVINKTTSMQSLKMQNKRLLFGYVSKQSQNYYKMYNNFVLFRHTHNNKMNW